MLTEARILEIMQRKDPCHPKDIAHEIFVAGRTFTESRWLHFEQLPRKEGGKTDLWAVYDRDAHIQIGIIKWHGSFRCYSFFPDPYTIFEPTCLTDITNFIHTQMREWQQQKQQDEKAG